MKYQFELTLDRRLGASAQGYNNEELSYLLTEAQLNVMFNKYSGLSNNISFEGNEKRRKELGKLVTNKPLIPSLYQTGVHTNGTFYDLPYRNTEECWLVVEERAFISSTTNSCISNKEIEVKPITHDQFTKNINNPFKKPYEKLVWRLDIGFNPNNNSKIHELITGDNITINSYIIRYIKKPKPIIIGTSGSVRTIEGYSLVTTIDCELDSIIHMDIVDEAVRLATKDSREYPQYQAENLENKINNN